MHPRLGQHSAAYDWLGTWDQPEASPGWAHHGVAITASGHVVAFDAAGDQVLMFTPAGELAGRWSSGLTTGSPRDHRGADQDGECLWIADPGQKMRPTLLGRYEQIATGQHRNESLHKTRLDYVYMACAFHLLRLEAFWTGTSLDRPRTSHLARL